MREPMIKSAVIGTGTMGRDRMAGHPITGCEVNCYDGNRKVLDDIRSNCTYLIKNGQDRQQSPLLSLADAHQNGPKQKAWRQLRCRFL